MPVTLERGGQRPAFGRMSQPVPAVVPHAHATEVLGALGAERSLPPVELYDNGVPHVYVALASVDEEKG